MINKLKSHPRILAFALGWLAVAALPPHYFLPALFVSFSGLLWLLNLSASCRQSFSIGYAFGFAFFAFGLIWIGNAVMIEARVFGWLYPLIWLGSGAFFGLFAALPAALAFFFRPFYARWLAFAAAWVLFEWLRGWLFTGFPWNLLGSVLAFGPEWLQFASLAGTYGLSLLVVLAAAAPAVFLCRPSRGNLAAAVILPLMLLAFLWGFGCWRLNAHPLQDSEITVRLVQPAIPQTMKWNPEALEANFAEYIALSKSRPLQDVDFVIWGETAAPFPLDLDRAHLKQLLPAVPEQGYLITGLVRYELDSQLRYHPYNSLFAVSPRGEIAASYDKSHLVPFGEYIPLREWLPDFIRPLVNVIGSFRAGRGPEALALPGFPSFGGLICYEVIFPGAVINRQDRPHWLINLTNDGWYGDSAGPHQHLVAARLRAVEEGITLVRSANTGISAVISPLGVVTASIGLGQKGILDAALPSPTEFSTTYSKYGNLTALIWCLGLLFAAGIATLASRRNRRC